MSRVAGGLTSAHNLSLAEKKVCGYQSRAGERALALSAVRGGEAFAELSELVHRAAGLPLEDWPGSVGDTFSAQQWCVRGPFQISPLVHLRCSVDVTELLVCFQ